MIIACLLLMGAAPANSRTPGQAAFDVSREEGNLVVSLEVKDLFDNELRETLSNGFTSTVATRITLVGADDGEPVTESRFIREIRYDVWEETYTITTYSEQGQGTFIAAHPEEVEWYCRRISGYRLCPLARLSSGRSYRFLLELLVVPISQEQLEKTKQWLRDSGAPAGREGESTGFGFSFGSVMDIFIGRSTGVEETRFLFETGSFRMGEEAVGADE